jgi:hypothetical protein
VRQPCLLDTLLEPGALSAEFQPVSDLGLPASQLMQSVHYMEGLVRGPRGTNLA